MLSGIGHSALSRQAWLVALFMATLVVEWALALADVFVLWLAILVVVVGAAAVLAVGLTYVLGSQPGWRHWSVLLLSPAGLLTSGVSLALAIGLGWRESLLGLSRGQVADLVLVLAGVCLFVLAVWAYTRYIVSAGPRTEATRTLLAGRYRATGTLGLVLVLVSGVAAAVSFATEWAIIVAFLASLAGFYAMSHLFFLAAVPLSWKSEVRWSHPPALFGKEA
jgi:hypothetical protein